MMGVGWVTFLVLRYYERRMAASQGDKPAIS